MLVGVLAMASGVVVAAVWPAAAFGLVGFKTAVIVTAVIVPAQIAVWAVAARVSRRQVESEGTEQAPGMPKTRY